MGYDASLSEEPRAIHSATRQRALVLTTCAFAAVADGFDTMVVGFTGPLLARDLHFPIAALGWVFSAQQFGAMVGAFVLGPIADRIGRARSLIICYVLAALLTVATTYTTNLNMLLALRFVTGLGLGGAIPCFLGLGVQALPTDSRRAGTAILYSMIPAGGVIGGLLSAHFVADYGWRGVFMMSAALVGLAIVPLVAVREPKSHRNAKAGSPLKLLFAGARTPVTLWIWALFLCTAPTVILLALWMPALIQMLGISASDASLLAGLMNGGSLTMSLVIGWLIHRFSAVRVMVPAFVLSALTWLAIALFHHEFAWLAAIVIVAGCLIGGANTGMVAISATLFPDEIRATGMGTAFGFGRLGQVVLPPVIGGALAVTASPAGALVACAVPSLLALIPFIALVRAERRLRASEQ